MGKISGNVQHAGSRNGGVGGFTPIEGVPVLLFRISDKVGMYANTGANGEYSFINVVAGEYKIVECGKSVSTAGSSADFSNATAMNEPSPSDPDYSKIKTPIANTNVVDSLSPNTILLTVGTAEITGKDFIDSTIKNTPLMIPGGVVLGGNILQKAGDGMWGTLPNGTAANTVPPSYPYTNSMTTGFTYLPGGVSQGVDDFFMKNIQTRQWFSLSNHTTFDETSSYISINGGNPNIIIFYEEVDVIPNQYYLATAWLCMNTNIPNTCKIGFRALAEDFKTNLFYGEVTNVKFGQWEQTGQIFNSKNNKKIRIEVLTMSTVAFGNDFSIDDVALTPADINEDVKIEKFVDKEVAKVSNELAYTLLVKPSSDIGKVYLIDTVPNNTSYVANTFKVNGVVQSGYIPGTGFLLGNIAGGATVTVEYVVKIETMPENMKILNSFDLAYKIDIPNVNSLENYIVSNTVTTKLGFVEIVIKKWVDKLYAEPGDTLVYTVAIENKGNISTDGNSIFKDTIPYFTTFINNSTKINGVNTIETPMDGINIGVIKGAEVKTVEFSVRIDKKQR